MLEGNITSSMRLTGIVLMEVALAEDGVFASKVSVILVGKSLIEHSSSPTHYLLNLKQLKIKFGKFSSKTESSTTNVSSPR